MTGGGRRGVRPVRVAYLLKRFPRLSQTLVLDEVLELERQGVDLVVLARRGSDEALVHRRVADLRAPVHLLHDASGPANVAQTLRDLGADHVHAHFATWAGTTAEAAAALAGLPFSVTAHATDLYGPTSTATRSPPGSPPPASWSP